jgi:hypothetical protein
MARRRVKRPSVTLAPPGPGSYGVDAAFMLLDRDVGELAGAVERRIGGAGIASAAVAPSVPESNCMDAALMS